MDHADAVPAALWLATVINAIVASRRRRFAHCAAPQTILKGPRTQADRWFAYPELQEVMRERRNYPPDDGIVSICHHSLGRDTLFA